MTEVWVKPHTRGDTEVEGHYRTIEYAPGIPEKGRISPIPTTHLPETWTLGTQRHYAQRRGEHVDLRLGAPSGIAYSWALPKEGLPEPGQAVRVPRVDDHTVEYMSFEGLIDADYGRGLVKRELLEPTEVLSASPNEIRFNRYKGKITEEYVARHFGNNIWEIRNYTPTRERYPEIPDYRPKYRTIPYSRVDPENDEEIIQPKIDGAHLLLHFRKAGRPPNVYSYRPGKGPQQLINHSHKFEAIRHLNTPKELEGLIIRGEGFVRRVEDGRVAPLQVTSGVLNAGVFKSRERQHTVGPLSFMGFDVVGYGNMDLSQLPYARKMEILRRVRDVYPLIELPDSAGDRDVKRQLLGDIQRGKHPDTKEGVVVWSKARATPRRAKIRPDFDVYIRRVEPGKGRLQAGMAGAVSYSLTPTGPIVGTVGSGFSDALRRDLMKNPKKYVGKVITVQGAGQFPGGAISAPTFFRFHPEKNL